MKGNDAAEPPRGNKNAPQAPIDSGKNKDRISENDKAIMDIKARMRKLRDYEKKLNEQDNQATEKCKELIRAG